MFALNVIEQVLLSGSCQGFGNGFTVQLSQEERELAESFRDEVVNALALLEPQSVALEEWDGGLNVVVMINDLTWSPIVNDDGIVFLQGIEVDEQMAPDASNGGSSDPAVWAWD